MTPFRPITVLHFTNATARGGAEEHILALLRRLDRTLFKPMLACRRQVAEGLRPAIPEDVELIPIDFGSPREVRGAFQLADALRENRVGILHSHMFWSSLFASPLGWFCRVPVVIETPHLREVWRQGWKASYIPDRIVARCVDRYIAVSRANAEYLRDKKKIPARKITVIESAIDLARYDRSAPVPFELKRSLGFQDSDPVLLIAGRLEAQKGHEFMLQAMPSIVREFPNAKLVCLSDGSLRTELERKAGELGIQHSVRFLGYRADPRPWFALCDFSILPSLYEGLPLAPIESLASGRTVVATEVDGTPEVVVNGKTGITVPPGDPTLLADAVLKLLRDPALRESLAQAGTKWVHERFGLDRLVQKTQQLYLQAWEDSKMGRAEAASLSRARTSNQFRETETNHEATTR